MKVQEILLEAPQLVDEEEFKLDDKQENTAFAQKLSADRSKSLIKSFGQNLNLYHIKTRIVLIDEERKRIAYYVRYREERYPHVGAVSIQQKAVWSDPSYAKTVGLAQFVFFNYILPRTGVIITDDLQTIRGQRFWSYQIEHALSMGKHIYYVNFMQPREITQIHNMEEYQEIALHREPWGHHQKFRARRLVISNKPLTEKND